MLHRFIMGAKKEDLVDHINGDKSDNRKANLRFATKSQNAQNSRKPRNKTGFIGVAVDWNGSIKAHIRHNGTKYHLGVFKTAIEAARAYDARALKLFGPEARTNLKMYQETVLELSGEQEKGNNLEGKSPKRSTRPT